MIDWFALTWLLRIMNRRGGDYDRWCGGSAEAGKQLVGEKEVAEVIRADATFVAVSRELWLVAARAGSNPCVET